MWADLEVDQLDLFGMDLNNGDIIRNQLSDASLNNEFNLLPERF
ncbi:MAG: hypothetical protein PHP43_08625 [Methanoculleus sp.]|nr:hypothetical protein [Methanoculleus sp.]